MKRYFLLLVATLLGSLLTVLAVYSQPDTAVSAPAADTIESFYFPLDTFADGRVMQSYQSVLGPNSCTSLGDPFTPITSPWEPGLYSYQYRIHIPADYDEDIVRVELFDPDSFNQSDNSALITHSQRWYTTQQNLGNNPPLSETLSCPSSDRRNACIIETKELTKNCNAAQRDNPDIFCAEDIALINPYWFLRVDENRTSCGTPSSYDTSVNTTTRFELYYYRELPDNTIIKTPLSSYTGQTGNATIDGESLHNTDLRWVSPGAFNYSGEVPADCGSLTGGSNPSGNAGRCGGPTDTLVATALGAGGGFEIHLQTDTPGLITDPHTGERYLYLDVTSVHGSSENGFDIWAGPPSASAGLSTNVNERNIQLADAPGWRDSKGVVVSTLGVLPINMTDTAVVDQPLVYVPAEYAGRTLSISLFDADSGTKPPLYFYFNTIPFDPYDLSNSEYYVAYGEGSTDPEGRCFTPYTPCQNEWVGPPGTDSPPYFVQIPTLSDDCTDPNDPAQKAICTPFNGGMLIARYQGGSGDTMVWVVNDFLPDPEFGIATSDTPLLPGQPLSYTIAYGPYAHSSPLTLTITHTAPISITPISLTMVPSQTITQTNPLVFSTSGSFLSGSMTVSGQVDASLTAAETLQLSAALTLERDGLLWDSEQNVFTRTVVVPQAAFITNTITVTAGTESAVLPIQLDLINPYAEAIIGYTTNGQPTGESLIIPAGAQTITLTLPLTPADESVVVQLLPVSGAGVGLTNTVTVTVESTNELWPTASFVAPALSVTEAAGTAAVTVTLDAPPTVTATVAYTTISGTAAAGSDYTAVNGTLTFPPNTTSQVITIPIFDDNSVETAETFFIQINALSAAQTVTNTMTQLTITDDDLPAASFTGSTATISETTTAVTLTVTLDQSPLVTTTVHYAASGGTAASGSDYAPLSGTLTFAPGQTMQVISLTLFDDDQSEANETIIITLTAGEAVQLTTPAQYVITITDDDPPAVEFRNWIPLLISS